MVAVVASFEMHFPLRNQDLELDEIRKRDRIRIRIRELDAGGVASWHLIAMAALLVGVVD